MNNKQKQVLVAYCIANCIIAVFAPSMIAIGVVAIITIFLYFKNN